MGAFFRWLWDCRKVLARLVLGDGKRLPRRDTALTGEDFIRLMGVLVAEDSSVEADHPEHGSWKVETGARRKPREPMADPLDGSPPEVPVLGVEHPPGPPELSGLEDEALMDLPDPEEGPPKTDGPKLP